MSDGAIADPTYQMIFPKHTPPLLHDVLRIIKHHVKVGGCACARLANNNVILECFYRGSVRVLAQFRKIPDKSIRE